MTKESKSRQGRKNRALFARHSGCPLLSSLAGLCLVWMSCPSVKTLGYFQEEGGKTIPAAATPEIIDARWQRGEVIP
jgi:hypothetical protein